MKNTQVWVKNQHNTFFGKNKAIHFLEISVLGKYKVILEISFLDKLKKFFS